MTGKKFFLLLDSEEMQTSCELSSRLHPRSIQDTSVAPPCDESACENQQFIHQINDEWQQLHIKFDLALAGHTKDHLNERGMFPQQMQMSGAHTLEHLGEAAKTLCCFEVLAFNMFVSSQSPGLDAQRATLLVAAPP